jgi:rhodanese-related sulfurtransferase
MMNGWSLHTAVIALALMAGALSANAQFSAPGGGVAQAGSAASIPQTQLLQPDALHHLLLAGGPEKPLVLQVGSHILFAEAHIPGSEYKGPGAQPQGLELLQSRLAPLSRKTLIVLYCGCCPWGRCPNVEPAFAKAREMGFTNVKVLYLADNFGTDWVSKGYPVEKGR